MADRYFNPFQQIDVNVPVEFHEALFERYSQKGADSVVDQSPFPRMVDLWFLSICVAFRLDLEPVDTRNSKTRKIMDGAILSSDPWRVHLLMLVAISRTGDVEVVADPRKMMNIANGLAVAGLPKISAMLEEAGADPIWNLTDGINEILNE